MKSFYPNCTPQATGHQSSVPGQTIMDCKKVQLGQVFSEYFGSPLPILIPSVFHIHASIIQWMDKGPVRGHISTEMKM